SVSDDGILVYRGGDLGGQTHFVWCDRTGTVTSEVLSYGDYRSVTLSPDGTRAAFHKHDQIDGGGVWVKDLTRGTVSRVTLDNARHSYDEVWHPDGRQLAFVDASPSSPAPGAA